MDIIFTEPPRDKVNIYHYSPTLRRIIVSVYTKPMNSQGQKTQILSIKRWLLFHGASTISFPEPANFLRRMLDKNEGSGKDQFLGDPDWLPEMQYNKISPLFVDY